MGLYACFTVKSLGYPDTLEAECFGQVLSVDVDYSGAGQAFVDAFMATATGSCPVRTGALRGSIDARSDGYFCEAEATAGYAGYVEYGTWKMNAQPFFEPGLQAGIAAFQGAAEACLQEANNELQDLMQEAMQNYIESMMDEMEGLMGEGSELMADMTGILMGVGVLLFLFPLLVNLYGILDTLSLSHMPGTDNPTPSFSSFAGTGVYVTIT